MFRSKGFLWLAGENDLYGDWSQAGSIVQIHAAAPWFAAIPEEAWEAQVILPCQPKQSEILKRFASGLVVLPRLMVRCSQAGQEASRYILDHA